MNALDSTVAREVAAGDDEGGAEEAHHCGFSWPISAAARIAGDRDERVVQAGPLDRQRLDPGAAVDQCLQQRLGAALAEARKSIRRPRGARSAGIADAPRPVAGAGAQPHDRPQARARLVDPAVERDLALGDDRDPLAQPLGVGDDVGREDDRRAGRAPRARISSSSRAWLIASSPEKGSSSTISRGLWMIVPSSCTVCAMPLDRVRIGFFAQSPRSCSASSASARRRPSASGRPRSAPMKAIASRACIAG